MDGIIYKLFRKSAPNKIYIGSSFHTKEYRLNQHKRNYKSFLNGKYHYITSFEIVKYDDVDIDVIENVKVDDENELREIEDKYINEFRNDKNFIVVNKHRASRTKKEYYQDNRDELKILSKKYHQEHKEQHNKRSQKYREEHREELNKKQSEKFNCPCGKTYTKVNKLRHEKSKKHVTYIINIQHANINVNN